MHVIISTSPYDLWENDIHIDVFQYIYTHSSTVETPKEIYKLPRDHKVVIDAFQYVYGMHLDNCKFAKIIFLPECFRGYYTIERIQCYKYVYYSESIHLNESQLIQDFCRTIETLRVSKDEEKAMLHELKQVIKKYKSIL